MMTVIPDKYVNEVCRVGAGSACCRYLAVTAEGWQCTKGTNIQATIDARVEAGEFNAKGDNCPGWNPGWYKKFNDAREAFLNLVADGALDIEYDADINSSGRQIDCSTFRIDGSVSSLEELTEALDIKRNRIDQSLEDAIQTAVEA